MKQLVTFFLLISALRVTAQVTIDHVEPPHWWIGMEHANVEILLHGKGIANYEISSAQLKIIGVTKTENPNYLFVTIETSNQKAGMFTFELKAGKKVVKSINYELKNRNVGSKNRESFGPQDVVYLLMPDRFANGDPANDSHPSVFEKGNRSKPGGRHGGDIQGMINHLDYIKSIGATTIWPTPMMEDNDSTYSYHTYGQSDLYKVDPRYGTNELYKKLVAEAHAKDLKIIQDMVPNHIGYMHWMMKDLPTYNWIHQFPGYAQSNYRMSTQMDQNHSTRDLTYCADGWFVPSMPDLNQSNPLLLNYLIQNALWWIEEANLDGFRIDTYSYNDKEGIAKWTKAITDEYPKFNMVGEVWLQSQAQISYWQKNSPISAIQSYNTYLPGVMDFTLHDAFQSVFNDTKPSWDQGMIKVYNNFVNDFLYADASNMLVFMENHDTRRFNQIYPSINDYRLGLTLIATVRGIPQIYYGSEVGMKGEKDKGDADIRKDFPGGWEGDTKNVFTGQGINNEEKYYLDFTKKLFNWRKNAIAVHQGKTIQFVPENNVYVYFRVHEQQTVMVVMNNSLQEQTLDLNRFNEVLTNYKSGIEIFTNAGLNFSEKTLKIAPKTAFIFELK